ncbi:MAG: type II toxin-antitoxin system RelB/DinJ family antitoxin [Lachnospiraceae bacterium]|nr:type II toxin-antitoxin system RelB/DinJ family antitoxin [Lachnospiraceae bacterium]
MATVQTQIRIEEDIKKQATELFNQLGIDMSSAVNMFLRQAIMREGLPFSVEIPRYKPEVMEAMEEAKRISTAPDTKRYVSFAEALEDIDLSSMD